MSEQSKDNQIRFNASDSWLREVDAAAELAGLSRSEFLRRAGMEKASATSPKEMEAKIKELEAQETKYERKQREVKNKKQQLQQQLEEFGDAREQYKEAVRELAEEIVDPDEITSKSIIEDASSPRVRKIAGIAEVEPQQVVRDVKNELAVESVEEIPDTDDTTETAFGKASEKSRQKPEAMEGDD